MNHSLTYCAWKSQNKCSPKKSDFGASVVLSKKGLAFLKDTARKKFSPPPILANIEFLRAVYGLFWPLKILGGHFNVRQKKGCTTPRPLANIEKKKCQRRAFFGFVKMHDAAAFFKICFICLRFFTHL